jgi:hypothetical protein
MTLQPNPPSRPFDIGRVLTSMSQAIGGNAPVFFGLALLLYAAPTALIGAVQYVLIGSRLQPGQIGSVDTSSQVMLSALTSIIGFVVSIVTTYILQASLTFGVVASLRGMKASLAECLGRGMRYFLTALVIGLVVGVSLVVVGLLTFWLLFIPAIILAIMWCVAVPVAVAENKGPIESLTRSASLTRNCRIMIFLLGLIWSLLYLLMTLAGVAIAAGFMAISMFAYALALSVVIGPLLGSVLAVLGAAMLASIYYELRQTKEGIGAEDLASIFS